MNSQFQHCAKRAAFGTAKFRAIWFVLPLALPLVLVTGCQNPGATRPVATVLGAGVGAAVGGILGGGRGAAIGAGAGAIAGLITGEVIYKEQMHLEAEKAASKARVDEAQKVLEKYREYNKYLSDYVAQIRSEAAAIKNGQSSGDQLAKQRKDLTDRIDKADADAKESDGALQDFRAKVESKEAASTDDQERQQLLKQIEDLKAQEDQLTSQMDALTGIRTQVAGG